MHYTKHQYFIAKVYWDKLFPPRRPLLPQTHSKNRFCKRTVYFVSLFWAFSTSCINSVYFIVGGTHVAQNTGQLRSLPSIHSTGRTGDGGADMVGLANCKPLLEGMYSNKNIILLGAVQCACLIYIYTSLELQSNSYGRHKKKPRSACDFYDFRMVERY